MPHAKLALVLGGGGNLGVVQVAFIKALQARGIEPDLVVGTSVGALNASYVAFIIQARKSSAWRKRGWRYAASACRRVRVG